MVQRLSALSLVILFLACAGGGDYSPVLVERGLKPGERKFQAENQLTLGLDRGLVDIYKDGFVAEGMTDAMVHQLWGQPNKMEADGKKWVYTDKKGNVISTVLFDSTKVLRGESFPVVSDIQGDRYGGSAPKR
jgi:hypothetical protein